MSFSCDSVHYHFYPSSSVHFSSTECCRVLSDVLINMFESWKQNTKNKLNICSLFGTGTDEWEIDKTLNKRAAKMTPSLKSCLFRDCQVGLLSEVRSGEACTIWWGRCYLVSPILSGEAGRYYLVRTILSGEAGTDWWGRYHLMRLVQSGEADTIWGGRYIRWGRYHLVRPVLSGEAGTIWWYRYYLVRPVLSGEAGTVWWYRYYLVMPVLSSEADTILWGRYYLVRPILYGEAGTVWWGRYHLVRPILSGKAGTICIARSDNGYSLPIQAYLIKCHPRLKQTALKIIPAVWGLSNLGQQHTNNVESNTQSKSVLPVRERFSIHLYNAHSHTDLKVHTNVHTRKLLIKACT